MTVPPNRLLLLLKPVQVEVYPDINENSLLPLEVSGGGKHDPNEPHISPARAMQLAAAGLIENLRVPRNALGISQSKLARISGVSRPTAIDLGAQGEVR